MRVLLTLGMMLVVNAALYAQTNTDSSKNFQAGVHYDLINPAWQGGTEEPVVYEFFSYMCPGCNAFEPHMDQLKGQLSGAEKIVRVPVAFYPQWEPHAKAYHALQMMGETEKVHKALFAAIHQYKKPLRTLEDISAWLSSSFGLDGQVFLSTANSFAVDSQLRKSKQMAQAMGIGRVPSLVVNGRFKPSFAQLKTPENILAATVGLLKQQ